MVIGTGQIKLRLFSVNSLKEKRRVIKPMIQRIKNKFNVSIAETGLNDSLLWAEIGFSMTGNDAAKINSGLDRIINMADGMGLAVIEDSRIEIIHLADV